MGVITDRKARSIKPNGKAFPTGVTGFWLEPGTKPGRGRWMLRYVSPVTHKRRDMGCGTYPDTSVARAIEKALAARQQIQDDRDPIIERNKRRAIPTFEVAARAHWDNLKGSFRNAKHRQDWINSLQANVFPIIGAIHVDALDTAAFARALSPIWTVTPETARRVRSRCASVMDFCLAHGYVTANPVEPVAEILPKQTDVEEHFPAMPWKLVPAFVAGRLHRDPLLGSRAALLFLILTAVRSGELRKATWSEIDLDARVWRIPAAHTKMRQDFEVPLSDAALEVLKAQPSNHEPTAYLFPNLSGKQMSDMALTSLLRKANAPSDAPGRPATAHGFRSSFRNWCAENGVDREVAERALAHKITNAVQAAYERTTRLQARRRLMDDWSRFVMGQKEADNVVPLRA